MEQINETGLNQFAKIIDDARDQYHPLHTCFEWNNTAGKSYPILLVLQAIPHVQAHMLQEVKEVLDRYEGLNLGPIYDDLKQSVNRALCHNKQVVHHSPTREPGLLDGNDYIESFPL